MTDRDTSFASFNRSYRPWGQVRRKNLMARILHIFSMTVLGVAALAGVALLFIFAASVAVVGLVTLALFTLGAFLSRTPVRIFVRARDPRDTDNSRGKGVYQAHKKGSTWSVY